MGSVVVDAFIGTVDCFDDEPPPHDVATARIVAATVATRTAPTRTRTRFARSIAAPPIQASWRGVNAHARIGVSVRTCGVNFPFSGSAYVCRPGSGGARGRAV